MLVDSSRTIVAVVASGRKLSQRRAGVAIAEKRTERLVRDPKKAYHASNPAGKANVALRPVTHILGGRGQRIQNAKAAHTHHTHKHSEGSGFSTSSVCYLQHAWQLHLFACVAARVFVARKCPPSSFLLDRSFRNRKRAFAFVVVLTVAKWCSPAGTRRTGVLPESATPKMTTAPRSRDLLLLRRPNMIRIRIQPRMSTSMDRLLL